MEKVIINSYEEFEKLVGQQIGVSDYVELSQERINLFADATLDHQWIHVDTERAKVHGTRIIESRHSCCTQKYPKGDESKKITNKKTRSCLPLRKTASLLCRYELNQLK